MAGHCWLTARHGKNRTAQAPSAWTFSHEGVVGIPMWPWIPSSSPNGDTSSELTSTTPTTGKATRHTGIAWATHFVVTAKTGRGMTRSYGISLGGGRCQLLDHKRQWQTMPAAEGRIGPDDPNLDSPNEPLPRWRMLLWWRQKRHRRGLKARLRITGTSSEPDHFIGTSNYDTTTPSFPAPKHCPHGLLIERGR